MIPVLGFCTLKRFDLAERLLKSIDYPVEHLVIVDNSGTNNWDPVKPDTVKNLWMIRVPFGLGLVGAWNLIVKSTPYAPYWILINDDAWFAQGSLETIANNADSNTISFPDIQPSWSCLILGEQVVKEVGLYDERFYPLYFDDDDYSRRIINAGFKFKSINAKVFHENSSTLNSGYQQQNNKTFIANQKLLASKVANDDFTDGGFDINIRRENRWD